MATSILTNASPNMQTVDFSLVVGTSAVMALTAANLQGRNLNYLRVWNVSTTATIWLSRSGNAVVGGAGSYPLSPGQFEVWANPQAIPINPLSIVSTAAGTPVTIEVG
jgi:hypothetical protein